MSSLTLELRIRGPGLVPRTMKAGDLAEVLVCLEKAVEAVANVRGDADDPDAAVLSLTGMTEGSACPQFTVSPVAWSAVAAILTAVARRDFDRVPRLTQAQLAALTRLFVRRRWEGEFVAASLPRAVISASNPVPDPPPPRSRGTTTLVGQCVRTGGVQPSAQVRPAKGGGLVTVQADRQLVKELGDRLYETVALEGEAVWDSDTWAVTEFRAARVLPYRQADPLAAFRELAAVSGSTWDGVDAAGYVRAARSGE